MEVSSSSNYVYSGNNRWIYPWQACIGAKVIASESLSAVRKDVLSKCYGMIKEISHFGIHNEYSTFIKWLMIICDMQHQLFAFDMVYVDLFQVLLELGSEFLLVYNCLSPINID